MYPIAQSTTKIYSRDRNIWHISHEGGALEDPANAAPDEIWMLTKSPNDAPDKAGEVTIGFERGRPVSVDGKAMKAFELLEALNQIGSKHAIGRIDLVENRFVGMKSRGCYETPGGALLMFAVRELEALALDKNTLHYKQKLALDWAEMVYNGLWFTPLREALDVFFDKVAEPVTGEVKLKLYKGNIEPLSRKSPFSLYSRWISPASPWATATTRRMRSASSTWSACPSKCAPGSPRKPSPGRQMKLWGGRFADAASRESASSSTGACWLRTSAARKAFAQALESVGILNAEERAKIVQAFDEIRAEAADPSFFNNATDEDVHTLVIRKLKETAGGVADKIHTGRSRNEQVSLDIRLWLREQSIARVGFCMASCRRWSIWRRGIRTL